MITEMFFHNIILIIIFTIDTCKWVGEPDNHNATLKYLFSWVAPRDNLIAQPYNKLMEDQLYAGWTPQASAAFE